MTSWVDALIQAGATLLASLIAVIVAIWLSHWERKSAREERISDEKQSRRLRAETRHQEVIWALKLQALKAVDRAIEELRELERTTGRNDQLTLEFGRSAITNAAALIAQFDARVGVAIRAVAESYPSLRDSQGVRSWAMESEAKLRAIYSSTLFAWYSQEAADEDEQAASGLAHARASES